MSTLRTKLGSLAVALLASVLGIAAEAATEYAPMAPLASRSLLLDLTAAGERLLVAGERGHILYSDDRGESWQQARVPTTQMLTGIHFAGDSRGWAVGHDGLILVSDDGGENWRVQRDGLVAQQQANIEQREVAHREVARLQQALEQAGDTEQEDLVLALEDAILDLEDADLALEEDVFTSPLMDVWFLDENRGWAVGAFGTMLVTDNGGQTWASDAHNIDNPDEFHLNSITGDGKGRIFIAGEGGIMFRSVDGGETWESLEPFYEGSWFGVLYSPHHDNLVVYGLRGNVYHSSDFGASWTPGAADNNLTLAGGAANGRGRVALVAGVGTLLISDDGGANFRRYRIEDRLSLASALFSGERLVLAGQGGVKFREVSEFDD